MCGQCAVNVHSVLINVGMSHESCTLANWLCSLEWGRRIDRMAPQKCFGNIKHSMTWQRMDPPECTGEFQLADITPLCTVLLVQSLYNISYIILRLWRSCALTTEPVSKIECQHQHFCRIQIVFFKHYHVMHVWDDSSQIYCSIHHWLHVSWHKSVNASDNIYCWLNPLIANDCSRNCLDIG